MKDRKLGRFYKEGEVIFQEGDKAENMYVIQRGRIKIVKESRAGESTLAVLQSGDIFGEMALFDRLLRSATAIVEEEANILSIDRARLFSTASQDPTLVFQIIESMSIRIRKMNQCLSDLLLKQSQQKRNRLEKTCGFILESMKNTLKCENHAIAYWKNDITSIECQYHGSMPNYELKKIGDPRVLDLLKQSKQHRLMSVNQYPHMPSSYEDVAFEMIAPLFHNDELIGLMSISDSSKLNILEPEKSQYAALINMAAFTFENAWVMDRVIYTTQRAMYDSAS